MDIGTGAGLLDMATLGFGPVAVAPKSTDQVSGRGPEDCEAPGARGVSVAVAADATFEDDVDMENMYTCSLCLKTFPIHLRAAKWCLQASLQAGH